MFSSRCPSGKPDHDSRAHIPSSSSSSASFFSPPFPSSPCPPLLAFQAFSSTARSLFFFTFVLPLPDEAFLPQGFPFAGASSSLRSLWCFRERFIRGRLRGSVEYTSALWFSRIYLGLMIVERKNTRYILLYAARREKFREWRGIGYFLKRILLRW